MNDLQAKIYDCECNECHAVKWLVEQAQANLAFRENAAGRLCELAVVAASKGKGIPQFLVVPQRRKYAEHLGIELSGPVSNSDTPNHIEWAIANSKHNPNAKNPIDLGRAMAKKIGERYFISMGTTFAQ